MMCEEVMIQIGLQLNLVENPNDDSSRGAMIEERVR